MNLAVVTHVQYVSRSIPLTIIESVESLQAQDHGSPGQIV